MRSLRLHISTILLAVGLATQSSAEMSVELNYLSSYSTGFYNAGGAEIASYDPETQRVFLTGAADNAISVVDISNPDSPELVTMIDLDAYGSGVNSVTVKNGIVAAAVEASPKTDPGMVVFFNTAGDFLNSIEVGALPDMLTFTHDGMKVLCANEGEPNDAYTVDPEGTISIIDLSQGVDQISVVSVDFHQFDGMEDSLRAAKVRIFGPNASASEDFEPEYITVSNDSRWAWVSIQEANTIAVLDIENAMVTDLIPLGYKDHSMEGNGFDATDRDNGVNILTHPIKGMYLPDGIASFSQGGQTFLVTANEGDTRAWAGYNEESRISAMNLDTTAFPNAAALKTAANMGRLTVTTSMGDWNRDGRFEELYVFGGRSFSIFSTMGELIFDSGDQFEKKIDEEYHAYFNSDHATNNSFDTRSDNKGPEPEGVTIGWLEGRPFAFINLERMGGVMIYDVSNPGAPAFCGYSNRRDFTYNLNPNAISQEALDAVGDLGPEASTFISAENSPNGMPMLILSNEISGNISIFNISVSGEPEMHFAGFTTTDNNHSILVTSARFEDAPVPSGWEVGVFTPGEMLAGGGVWDNDEQLGICAWGDDNTTEEVEGFMEGEMMSFRLWDNVGNREYWIGAIVQEGSLEWTIDGETLLMLDQVYTMNIDLQQNWNLISVNVMPPMNLWRMEQGPDVRWMMAQFDGNLHIMKDERGRFYWPAHNFNNIPYWDLSNGYQVKMDTAASGSWTGWPIPANADIEILTGWNMIAYYPNYELSVSSESGFYALSSIINYVIIAKDRAGNFLSPPNNFSNMGNWRESQGYQIKVSEDVVLNYPAQADSMVEFRGPIAPENAHWSEPANTGLNMSILVTSIEGKNARNGDQVAAIDANGVVVGVGTVQERGMCGLAVWGDDLSTEAVDGLKNGEAFTLRLWDADNGVELALEADVEQGSLSYETDGFADLAATASVTVPETFYLSNSYPNPFNSTTRIAFGLPEAGKVAVQVFDMTGRLVATLADGNLSAGNHAAVWNADAAPAGLYMVKMSAGSFSETRKLTLVK